MRTLLALTAAALATPALPCTTDAMLVFDGSGSMGEINFDIGPNTRIVDARVAVAEALPDIEALRDVGLVTYGPGGADGCSGISLKFPPRPNAALPIIAEINALSPDGLTPLAASVQVAAKALRYETRPAMIVLVTDGNETCGGTPCALSEALSARAEDLTIHVIGFKFRADLFAWDNPEQEFGQDTVARCLADRTGGMFVTTETVSELAEALRATLGCVLIGLAPSGNYPRIAQARG